MGVTGAGHSESASKHPRLVPVNSPLIQVNPVSVRGVEMIDDLILLISKIIDGQKGRLQTASPAGSWERPW